MLKYIEDFYHAKKSQIFLTLILSIIAIAISACNEIDAENGEVPAEYVQQVRPYLGQYFGKVDGKPMEINIVMNGNKPELKVKNAFGNDITGQSCRSQVGDLKSFKAKDLGNKNYALEHVNFYFDTGFCMFQGKVVTLKFESATEFDLEILEKDDRSRLCLPRNGPPGAPPIDECTEMGEVRYLRGSFSK